MISLYETTANFGLEKALNTRGPKHSKLFSILLLLSLPIALGVYLYVISQYYVDFSNYCMIRVRASAFGNSNLALKRTITGIKDTDLRSYLSLCRNVKVVSETECLYGDENSPKLIRQSSDGCYMYGTGYIYLRPADDTDATTEKRTELLVKMAKDLDY